MRFGRGQHVCVARGPVHYRRAQRIVRVTKPSHRSDRRSSLRLCISSTCRLLATSPLGKPGEQREEKALYWLVVSLAVTTSMAITRSQGDEGEGDEASDRGGDGRGEERLRRRGKETPRPRWGRAQLGLTYGIKKKPAVGRP